MNASKLKRTLIAVSAAGILILTSLAVPAVRWRYLVVTMKAAGRLESISWSQLLSMMRPDSGISLGSLPESGNPYVVIRNPLGSEDDKVKGKELFDRRCAECHAGGGDGPALAGREFNHGDSDWALFVTITRGVAGTAMPPAKLSDIDVWRVISYLRILNDQTQFEPSGILGAERNRPVRETTYTMLRAASDATVDWLLPSGSYDSRRFSTNRQIDKKNVRQLGVQWIHQFGTRDAVVESIPVVVDGRMYVTLPTGTVTALDARTGERIWVFTRPPPSDLILCCPQNRGVAVLGNRIYVGTLDAHLIALDAATGKLLWDRAVANYREGYSITSPPLPIDGLIVTGNAGGDYATRGFISAYDAETGTLKWRFNTIPAPGERGNDSWGEDSWKTGGVSTWMTGSFDPDLNLIYWGTGNPAPNFNVRYRPGDNLYSNSVVALDASTGKLVWYFQFTPGDDHDWDSVQTPILIDRNEGGVLRKLLVVASRNGIFYVLDRLTGEFLRAEPFVKQTWATGITPSGRPIRNPSATVSERGTLTYPGMAGGTNAAKSAYSPITELYYVPALERSGTFFLSKNLPKAVIDEEFRGSTVSPVRDVPHYSAVRAIDPATAKVRWEHRLPLRYEYSGNRGGLLATAGGLVFGNDESKFFALDADTGKPLWSFEAGGLINAAPVTYSVDGRQYLAVAAGDVMLGFALPEPDLPKVKRVSYRSD